MLKECDKLNCDPYFIDFFYFKAQDFSFLENSVDIVVISNSHSIKISKNKNKKLLLISESVGNILQVLVINIIFYIIVVMFSFSNIALFAKYQSLSRAQLMHVIKLRLMNFVLEKLFLIQSKIC